MPIRIVIAEDQFLVRDALARLLSIEADIEVVGQAQNGLMAVDLVLRLEPDLILLDIEMPEMDGLQAAERIHRERPNTVMAVLTTFSRPGYLQRAIACGVAGFLLKDQPVAMLANQIRRLARGERVLDPELAMTALLEGPSPLTEREGAVLKMAADGRSAAQMASVLYLSEGTVRNYLSLAIQKLGVENRAQAVRKAQENGWI